MSDEIIDAENYADTDDEDYEIYFLQPASSPYNIREKLEAANQALQNESVDLENRNFKIKFKDDLVDYEPDLTDDDVQSIESYNEVDLSIIEKDAPLETIPTHPQTKLELVIFTPVLNVTAEEECMDEEGTFEDDKYENYEEEEVDDDLSQVERIKSNTSDIQFVQLIDDDGEDKEVAISLSESSEHEDISYKDIEDPLDSCNVSTPNKSTSFRSTKSSRHRKTEKIDIDCKSHCIEKLESDLNLTIGKLQIIEKPTCPALRLTKRKCCEENRSKNQQKLPCYSGLRSEYGLSLSQLERRQRQRQVSKLREDKRKRLVEEYKERKVQQNEEIFCEWLKDVAKRKREQAKLRENHRNRKVNDLPTPPNVKSRPKTAATQTRNAKKPRRPRTSPACVYIQMSSKFLRE